MNEIPAKYSPSEIEDKWYQHWLDHAYFKSVPDEREPFTIVIPPPNVTGVLHMGHMLNNTIQDILVRRARMLGYNACWLPGTDHASIATEAKVVAKLKGEGIEKSDLTREEFLRHAWEWKEKHGGIILEQLKKLGASCDWDRTSFTMDPNYDESVREVFIDLYDKGLIYRGVRMVNWDPKALTAVSDEEVVYKEVKSKLWHVRYRVEGMETSDANGDAASWITIATTRPETILGDTAVCVHPEDPRYLHMHGKKVIVPLVNRAVPVITDTYVDMEFGTGCLKITPAHDINDYEIGIRYNLPVIDIFNDDGTLSEKATLFVGMDRFAARDAVAEALAEAGHLVKIEDYVNKVGCSERTDEVIEPKLSMQWFFKMSEISKPALTAVMEDHVQFHPAKFKNIYRHWMENIRDWCISRQLWWGQRIPVFYLPDGRMVAAKTAAEAVEKVKMQFDLTLNPDALRQDADVLDTWFSSWLWPIAVFDGIRNPDNEEIRYYYPTNDLVTAPEILFFWVARMIMAGHLYRQENPFKNVYLTGIVRDKLGRKMSKQLGNSPDPIMLMKQYGADGVRAGMLFTSPAGNDLPFDEGLCEQGRNFCNKIWNALRLVKGWTPDPALQQPDYAIVASQWFDAKLNQGIVELDELYSKYRLSEALMTLYKLIWDDFCSWYLEMVKPAYQQPVDEKTLEETIRFFETLMKLLHPFMPFISEEIWHRLSDREEGDDLVICAMPAANNPNPGIIEEFELASEVIMAIRTYRQEKGISPREATELFVKGDLHQSFMPVIRKLGNLSALHMVDVKPEGMISLVVKSLECAFPLPEQMNKEEEIARLQKELDYAQGFLKSVEQKLQNKKFMDGAPQPVIDAELKKRDDARAKIEIVSSQIDVLKG
jgi:valyl-tRNA synthetase